MASSTRTGSKPGTEGKTSPAPVKIRAAANAGQKPVISVVIPMLNEEKGLDPLLARLLPVMDGLDLAYEVILIDDGSTDGSAAVAARLCRADARIRLVRFSRNFGKEAALQAGWAHASGKAVIQLDADLQHPPEQIPAFIEAWRAGAQIAYGQRRNRDDEGPVMRVMKRAFYRIFRMVSEVELMEGLGDFLLLDRKVVDALLALPERGRFTKGLYAWVGFERVAVPFEVERRFEGRSRWSLTRLLRFALEAITGFGSVPLKIWSYVGLCLALPSLAYGGFIMARTLLFGIDTPGYASLMVALCFFSGVQLIGLGIIGEYLSRVLIEVKGRPLYIVGETVGFAPVPEPRAQSRASSGTEVEREAV